MLSDSNENKLHIVVLLVEHDFLHSYSRFITIQNNHKSGDGKNYAEKYRKIYVNESVASVVSCDGPIWTLALWTSTVFVCAPKTDDNYIVHLGVGDDTKISCDHSNRFVRSASEFFRIETPNIITSRCSTFECTKME